MSDNIGNLGAANLLKNKANHAHTAQNTQVPPPVMDSSPSVGDLVFDGGIAFFLIIMAAFFAIGFLEKGRE